MNTKLEKAIEWMGERYLMHPSRRVQRLRKGAQRELHKTDIAATFRRITRAQKVAQ